ncbi:MAG: tetratricopeptide repeat protein [Candidatus Xenobiia bacterium LiM19]
MKKIDRDMEYKMFHERKGNLARALGITLTRQDIDKTRYQEQGEKDGLTVIFHSEGEGSAKVKRHGYFEVLRLSLCRLSQKKGVEESVSLNYENSELYTSFRDRDFWMEYSGNDVNAIKEKFAPFKEAGGDSLKDRILKDFSRQAERATRSIGQDSVFFTTISVPIENVEELMYQIITGNFSSELVIPPAPEPEPEPEPPPAPPVQEAPPPEKKPDKKEVEERPQKEAAAQTQVKTEAPPRKEEPEAPQKEQTQPAQEGPPPAASESQDVEEGMHLLSEKKYEEAVEYYKTKAKKSPKDPEGWFGLSACLFLTGEIKKCTLYYNRCSDIDAGFDIYSRLISLAGTEYEKFVNLAEHMITLESQKEAQKYIDYLSDKELPEPLRERLNSLRR